MPISPRMQPDTSRSFIDTQEQFDWLLLVVKAILVLNLFDAVFTLIFITSGYAYELNPLFSELIETSPVVFVMSKIALVSLGSLLLWRHRERASAVVAIFFVFLVYYLIFLWHLNLITLFLGWTD